MELVVTVTNIVPSSDGWVDTLTIMFGDGACPNASHAGVTDDALVSSCIVGDGVAGEYDVHMFHATQGSTDRNNAPKAVLDAVLESVSPSAGAAYALLFFEGHPLLTFRPLWGRILFDRMYTLQERLHHVSQGDATVPVSGRVLEESCDALGVTRRLSRKS